MVEVKNGPWMLSRCYSIKYLQIDIEEFNSIVIKNRKSSINHHIFFLISKEKFLFAINRLKLEFLFDNFLSECNINKDNFVNANNKMMVSSTLTQRTHLSFNILIHINFKFYQ